MSLSRVTLYWPGCHIFYPLNGASNMPTWHTEEHHMGMERVRQPWFWGNPKTIQTKAMQSHSALAQSLFPQLAHPLLSDWCFVTAARQTWQPWCERKVQELAFIHTLVTIQWPHQSINQYCPLCMLEGITEVPEHPWPSPLGTWLRNSYMCGSINLGCTNKLYKECTSPSWSRQSSKQQPENISFANLYILGNLKVAKLEILHIYLAWYQNIMVQSFQSI